jgi:hypothetical protein
VPVFLTAATLPERQALATGKAADGKSREVLGELGLIELVLDTVPTARTFL